jgi:hypothetical protein
MGDLLGLQLEYDITHVREDLHDRLHHRPLGLCVPDRWEISSLLRSSRSASASATCQGFANLVDPELQAEVEASVGLLVEDAHGRLSGISGGDMLGPQTGVGIGLIVDIEVIPEHVPPEVDPI